MFLNHIALNHCCFSATSITADYNFILSFDSLSVWCGLSVIGQSEDGADQDSPEEGTPASPRNKRRVGRPGRKRKQLLPVSTTIIGCRQPFILYTAAEWLIICLPMPSIIPLSNLKSSVEHACTLLHISAFTPVELLSVNQSQLSIF